MNIQATEEKENIYLPWNTAPQFGGYFGATIPRRSNLTNRLLLLLVGMVHSTHFSMGSALPFFLIKGGLDLFHDPSRGFYHTTCSDHEEITVICKKLWKITSRSRHDKLSDHTSRKNHWKITENHGKIMVKSWSRHGHDVKFGGNSRSCHDVK